VVTCRTLHHRPRPGCAWCQGRLSAQSAFGVSGRNGQPGLAA
jgi:hypothetical protein